MYLGNKKFIFLIFYFFTFFFYEAQTLYWVGGSGNFNDVNHWSYTSGGKPANVLPNSKTDVIFDDNTSFDYVNPVVNFVGINYCKSLKFVNEFIKFTVIGSKFSELNISGDFELNYFTYFKTNSSLIFTSSSNNFHNVKFNQESYEGDVIFKGGNWNLKNINIYHANTLRFISGNYKVISSQIKTGNFYSNTNEVNFEISNGKFDIKEVIEIGLNTHFSAKNLLIKANQTNPSNYKINSVVNLGNSYKIINSSTPFNSVCNATLSSVGISCSGACDGKLILDIDITCAPGPYTLAWNNPSCPIPTLNLVPGPGTYTIDNFCSCADFYDVTVFTGTGPIAFSNAINIPGVSAINFVPFSFVQPTCFGFCNGSIMGNISGSVGPYTVTLNGVPSNSFAVLAGVSTFTNLCSGINTFVIVDTKGCTRTFTPNLNQPLALGSTSITSSVTCNAACNGSISLSPTNGTANYTVNFSPGGTFTVPAAGTASLTNLCPGPISYTITDSKACTINSIFNIIQPPALTVTATQTNVSCGGTCDGSASVTVSGGTSPYTFSWTPGPNTSTNSIINLCVGNQTVNITDFNGCVFLPAPNFIITSPPPITITPTFTNASCNLLCNATASASATGGTGLINFTLTSTSSTITTSPPWTNLCAGTYTIRALDAAGCSTTIPFVITQPPALTITATSQSITCFGLCNGSATVSPSGGNGLPFNYTWTPLPPLGQGTGTISNVCFAGVYTVSVTDASLCPITTTISIVQPASVTPNISSGSLTCNGVPTGSINANPTPLPLGPFSYTLSSSTSTVFTPPPYTNLSAGIYTLTIGYGSGCSSTSTINIQQPNLLIPSINSTSITCFNQCNGTLSGSAIGGSPFYSFVWTTPTGTVSGGALVGQCAGNYTFSIIDANGCSASSTVALNQPPEITVTINSTSPTCFASCNGALSALVSGGTPGYTLNWSNGPTGNPNTGLCAGNYTLVVTDSRGCLRASTATVTAPTSLALTQTSFSTSCAGVCDGSATITAIGGTGPYIFQFNTLPVTTNTSGILSALCAGNYIANVIDANSCSQSINFAIISPPAVSAAITGLQSSCNACTGASTVTASNGTPGYTYVWINSLAVTVGTNAAVGSLCAGSYSATVTDSKGCTATATTNVLQTVSVTVATAGSPILCFGACTGSATANALGGTLPYNYTWTPTAPTQTTQSATGLCAGVYVVLVADQLGCSNTATITFINPPDIIIAPTQTNVTCFGNCNGAINSNVTGGTAPLSYSWSPGLITTPNLSGLCAGNYTLSVNDVNGCAKSQTISILSTNSISATFTTTNPSACVISNGSICVTPFGGTGLGYTYTWSPAGGVGGNTSCYSGLNAGPYSVIITDNAGCTGSISTQLTNPGGPTLNILTQSVTCFGANTGAATVTALGTGPFTFTWTPVVGFTTIGNTSTASGLNTGTYNISVTDISTGCITSQSIVISQPSTSITINSFVSSAKCFAACNGSITTIVTGGTPGYLYSWLPSLPPISGQGTPTITNLCAGNYTLNLTDNNLCLTQVTYVINQPALLTLTTTPSNVLCNAACNGSINVTAVGGTSPITYTWLPVFTFTGSTNQNIFNLCPAIYTVNATDINNCLTSTTVQIIQPTALTSTISIINASCSNSCNASATLIAGGGVPTYSFSWSNGPAITSSLGSLCAGNYTATVTDVNGCNSSQPFVISSPSVFNLTLTPSNPLCNSVCNGSISTILSGAQGTVNFNWLASGTGQNPTNLCAGNYTLTATDAFGCVATGVTSLFNPPALLANVSVTNPACNGNCNGIAVSNPANAVGPVSYTWLPTAPTQTNQIASGLCVGNYTLLIQDNNNCQDIQTFTLISPPALNVNASIGPATCGVSNGSITAIPFGGTPAYTFSWTAPVSSTNSSVSGLAAGVYTVIISDANNCTNTLTIPLSNSNGPSSAPIISSSISCNGQCTGAASINIASILGGTPGYAVSWIPPSTSSINPQVNLCAGTYTAQISDANNCLLFNSVTIAQPAAISVLSNLTFPTCNGICNGSITLSTFGGISPYTYTWIPSVSTTATLTNACAGNYTVLIGNNGCPPSTQTLNLPGVLNMNVITSLTNNVCFGNCNGTASVVSVSGTSNPPVNYIWSNLQTGAFATSLCNGVYTFTATDAIGCFNSFTTNITSPSQITAANTIISPSCNICNGSSTVSAIGGTAPYTYTWSTGSNSSVTNGLCAGLYQVTINDIAGCQIIQPVLINNLGGITSDIQTITNEQCFGSCNGSATIVAVGGASPITYNWLNPPVSNSIITNLCGGNTYFLQMTDAVGCIRNASISINSTTQLTLNPFVTYPTACGLTNGTINVVASGGTPVYNYAWLPAGSASSLTNIGAGSYTLTVTDNNFCAQTQAFTISNFTGPLLTFNQTNINCFNACTGAINATATSTALPVLYNWSNGATTTSVSNLCSGVITLTVTDANLCRTIQSFTITDNPQIQLGAVALQQPACNLCNGSSTVSAIGGIAPYTYTWSTGSNSPTTSSLCAGLYQVTVNDNLGCQTTQTIILNNINGITADTKTITNEQCFGSCNGAATVVAVGGTPPIAYNWISPVVSNSVVTNLCGGNTYFLQMTDALGCIRNTSVAINSAVQITLTPSIFLPSCGLSNGTINVVPSGGAPAYNFLWLPSSALTSSLANIGAGSYTLIVNDASPCSQTQVFNISNFNGPLITFNQTNIDCFNTCTGAINAIGTSTALPVSYNWSNGATTSSVANLCSGVITLTVTDGNLCRTIRSFTITQNSQIQIGALAIQQPVCNMCNGGSTVSALGISPFTYSWTNGSTTNSASNLCSGLYQVLISDGLGCQTTQNIVINNSNGITGQTINVQNEICFGSCTGAATVNAVGGTAPITYNWITPSSTNNVVNNLCAGNYFVQMTDAQGCIRTSSIIINSAIHLTLTPSVSLPSCSASNGTINVLVSGGTPSYVYSWLPAGSTSSLANIGAGSYTLTVTDNSLCSQSQVFNIGNITGPVVTEVQSNINCFNACTGSITAIGTSTALPISYLWSNGVNTQLVTNLCTGIITLTVTDGNLCKTIKTYTLIDNPDLQFSLPNIVSPLCNGDCNGAITIIPSGGSLPYAYSWLPNANNTNPISSICSGTYLATITDGRGCAKTQTISLSEPLPISFTSTLNNSSCSNLADGSASISVIGGTPSYTYAWSGPAAFTGSTQIITNLLAGTYSLSLTDNNGCKKDTLLEIVPTITIVATANNDFTVCPTPSVTLTGTNSINALTYNWFLVPNNTNTVANTSTFLAATPPTAPGSYTYELVATSSVASCFDRDTVVVNIYALPNIDAGPTYTIPAFSTINIGGSPTATGSVTLLWSPAFNLDNPTVQNPTASNTVNTVYTITATDLITGCIVSDTMTVFIYPEIKIPNGFSPNGDSKNERWIIDNIEQFSDNTVEVFNRWGEQLFYSQGYATPFDGKFKGKDLPVGTYYYVINLNHPVYNKPFTGPLTIFR